MWRVPEGSEVRWLEHTSTYASNSRHIALMVSFKKRSGSYYTLNTHMERHRALTQHVQPMDLKGFLIKHLLNVIKHLGLLKHSTEMSQITNSFHFSLSDWI